MKSGFTEVMTSANGVETRDPGTTETFYYTELYGRTPTPLFYFTNLHDDLKYRSWNTEEATYLMPHYDGVWEDYPNQRGLIVKSREEHLHRVALDEQDKRLAKEYRHIMMIQEVEEHNNDSMLNDNTGELNFCLTQNKLLWLGDSGATCHIVKHRQLLMNIRSTIKVFIIGDGTKVVASKVGTYTGKTAQGVKYKLEDVYVVPQFAHNIVSIAQFLRRGCLLQSKAGNLILTHPNVRIDMVFKPGHQLGVNSSLFFMEDEICLPDNIVTHAAFVSGKTTLEPTIDVRDDLRNNTDNETSLTQGNMGNKQQPTRELISQKEKAVDRNEDTEETDPDGKDIDIN